MYKHNFCIYSSILRTSVKIHCMFHSPLKDPSMYYYKKEKLMETFQGISETYSLFKLYFSTLSDSFFL